ncbi:putative ABC transporter ATP-binding protein YxlF [compost metagenome]
MDEPTAGLDPEERIRFRHLLCEVAANRIVLLSTHIVEDIEKTCPKIAVLEQGQIIFQGLLQEFIGYEKNLEAAYMKRIGGRPQ